MNFYPFHIGDYSAHTAHLDLMEDLAYRRMMDLYYLREGPLPSDPIEVAKLIRMRSQLDTVKAVLSEFFTETDAGWTNTRCDYEVGEAQSKRTKAQLSAAARWESERIANAKLSDAEGNAPTPNTTPNTNTKTKGKPNTLSGYPDEFEAAWAAYPRRPGASKKDSFRAWAARVKDGVDPDVILDGTERYAAYCLAVGTNPQYVKQPTTFFGPSEHYLADWSIPSARASPALSAAEDRQRASELLTGRRDHGERVIDGTASVIS